jgi:hypothetical protein
MMIRRTLFLIAVPLIISIAALVLLGELVGQLRGKEQATVYFKPGVVEGGMREGEVTKKDKYIVINSAFGEENFTWDQINYIKDKDTPSKRLDRTIDVIELVSKLGIAASVIVFLLGLYQYDQGQKWKREEFLAGAVKEFIEQTSVRNAMRMLDSLALYEKGITVKLFPDKEKYEDRTVFVSNEEVYRALTTESETIGDDNNAKEIRACFDGFLSYLETFHHYIVQGLITKDALRSHIGYWIDLLGPGDDLSCRYKRRIFAYADEYGFYDIEPLIQKYYDRFEWRELPLVRKLHYEFDWRNLPLLRTYYRRFDWRELPCSEEEEQTQVTRAGSRLTLSKILRNFFLGLFASVVLIRAWFKKKPSRGKKPRP